MLKDGLAALLPHQQDLVDQLKGFAEQWKAVPMLARTHGQTASPTTIGKELAVFADRLAFQMKKESAVEILGKLNAPLVTLMRTFPLIRMLTGRRLLWA